MTVRALDSNGDIVTRGVQFLTGYSSLEVAQNARTRLKEFTGEWFLNTLDGTPWMPGDTTPGIMGKSSMTQSQKETIIRQRILLTPGCAGMASFSAQYDLDTRQFSIQASIITTSNETALVNFVQAIF